MPVVAVDLHGGIPSSKTSPADQFFYATPSDSDDLPFISREITFDGVNGTVKVKRAVDNVDVTLTQATLTAQPVQSIRVKKIYATGTTHTGGIFVKA
jgi:hypothetical protein